VGKRGRTLAGTAIVATLAGAVPALGATLTDDLHELVGGHPQILSARSSLSSSEQDVEKVRGTYLPSLDVRGDTGPDRVDNLSRRGANLDPFVRNRSTYAITLTQKIWDGGAREARYEIAKFQQSASESSLTSTTQNVTLEGVSAYLDVLKQGRLVELASQNEANIRRQLQLEQERQKRGSGNSVDVLQARSRLQLAQERRVAFEGSLTAAQSRYRQVFGHPAELATMSEPTPPEALIPDDLTAAVDRAQSNNPTLATGRSRLRALDESRAVAEAGYLPTIGLALEHGYELNYDAVAGSRWESSVLLKANWNLFNGFQTRADVRKASFDHAAGKSTLDHAERKIAESTELAWQTLQTARQRVSLLRNATTIAENVFVARQKLRDAGKETALNVLDAENELYIARINHVTALYDMKLAAYQLLQAMGELDPDRIAEVSAKP